MRDSPGEAAATDPQEPPPAGRSAHSPRSPHTRWESSLLGTATRMQEPWDSPGGGFRCPERQGPSEGGGRLPHRGAGSEQRETAPGQGHLHSTEDLDAQLRGRGDMGAAATACSCSDSETLMEVAEPDPAGREEAGGKSVDGPALGPDDLPMEVEVEASEGGRSVPESRVAMSESRVAVSGTSDGCQPSAESAEESCSSLTAALKELHGLLVISSKTTASGSNTSEEITRRPEAGAEDRSSGGDRSQRRAQSEQRARSSIATAAAAGTQAAQSMDLGASGGGLSIAKAGVSESGEPVTEGGSVAPASPQMSRQPQSTLSAEMPPAPAAEEAEEEEGALGHTCEPAGWASSGSGLARDPGQGTQAAGPRLELPTPVFPAADIERILRAGFTLQEALGALHRVGGNADLALLVLLAKNIVVPT